jgi:uncharacterized protein (DUF2237 family)
MKKHKNIYGRDLQYCNLQKVTGYNRNGKCELLDNDEGTHIVCAVVTDEFLNYTLSKGNDLITPRGGFPGLVAGDNWCLCALRWLQAYKANPKYAPPIIGECTHEKFLNYVPKDIVEKYVI